MTVTFYNTNEIPDEQLKYAAIVAIYGGKWIFCRHKKRNTWEIPGGHREFGESILDTAKRELYEETGATKADFTPVSACKITDGDNILVGILFYAKIYELCEIPSEFEMQEIMLSNTLPTNLTYPQTHPHLFNYIQGWLNLQSNPDELWDVYDVNRQLTGRTHRRGDKMNKGDYHLVVQVWLQNSKGKYLLTKRTPNKGFPNMWECTGGSALAGDDSITAAIREVREETGLSALPENGKCILSYCREDSFVDIWIFKQDFNLDDVVLQPNETCGAMYSTKDEILKMRDNGTFVPISYLDEFFRRVEQ